MGFTSLREILEGSDDKELRSIASQAYKFKTQQEHRWKGLKILDREKVPGYKKIRKCLLSDKSYVAVHYYCCPEAALNALAASELTFYLPVLIPHAEFIGIFDDLFFVVIDEWIDGRYFRQDVSEEEDDVWEEVSRYCDNDSPYLLSLVDILLNNEDRVPSNVIIDNQGRMWGIDNANEYNPSLTIEITEDYPDLSRIHSGRYLPWPWDKDEAPITIYHLPNELLMLSEADAFPQGIRARARFLYEIGCLGSWLVPNKQDIWERILNQFK